MNTDINQKKAAEMKKQNEEMKKPTTEALMRKDAFEVDFKAFRQNPLIKKLAVFKSWTLSDSKKRPLHFTKYQKTKTWRLFFMDSERDNSALGSLKEIDAFVELKKKNRTIRMNAHITRTICIDVEPYANEEVVSKMLEYPSDYTEISRNGGFHIFLEIPNDLINEEDRQLLKEQTVIKYKSHEVILNNHFVTFSQKVLYTEPVDKTTDIYREKIRELLNDLQQAKSEQSYVSKAISKQYSTNKKPSNKKVGINIEHDIENVDALVQCYLKDINGLKILNDEKDTFAEMNSDFSQWEFNIIIKTLSRLKWQLEQRPQAFLQGADIDLQKIDDKTLVHTVYELVQTHIPQRAKHMQLREQVPFLLFQTWRANDILNKRMKNNKKQ